jgi:hypothetical protein
MSTTRQPTIAVETGPIAPGSEALRNLLARIAGGAAAREREGRAPHEVIDCGSPCSPAPTTNGSPA